MTEKVQQLCKQVSSHKCEGCRIGKCGNPLTRGFQRSAISNQESLGVNTMTFTLMDKRIDSKIKKKNPYRCIDYFSVLNSYKGMWRNNDRELNSWDDK